MNEFELIYSYFRDISPKRSDVLLGIGDDAALLRVEPNHTLVVSTDSMVSGVHFLSQWPPADIAWRAVMTAVSDLAAMGATPCWMTLALTLPEVDCEWLADFSRGISTAISATEMALIGGDTTKGPLNIGVTVFGQVPFQQEIKRSGARSGDIIFVSGYLGAAALALKNLKNNAIPEPDNTKIFSHLLHPYPRLDWIPLLRRYASAVIDISDGLSADLNHLCVSSQVGARLEQEAIPLHPLLKKYAVAEAVDIALFGGDDYELCFTVPATQVQDFLAAVSLANLHCFQVGTIIDGAGIQIIDEQKNSKTLEPRGYQHFN